MKPELLPWIILFLPLAAAGIIALFTLRNRPVSAVLSIGAVVAGFILSIIYIGWAGWQPAVEESSFTWLVIGDVRVDFGLRFDALSLMMLLVVTGVASAIHIYYWVTCGRIPVFRGSLPASASLRFRCWASCSRSVSSRCLFSGSWWEFPAIC